jgi:hypothetical protein
LYLKLVFVTQLRPQEWTRPTKNSKYYAKPRDLSKRPGPRARPAPSNSAAKKEQQPAAPAEAPAVDHQVVHEIDERLKKLSEVEKAMAERENKIAEMWQHAEAQAKEAAEAVARFQEQQKKAEEERLRMQQLLDLAAGPLSHRTDAMSTNGNAQANGAIMSSTGAPISSRPSSRSRRGSKSGQLSARERGLPPTALSARGGAGIPADATTVSYEGDDWVQLWDPDEYAWYWYNRRTQVAQWEYPGTVAEYGYNSGYESEGGMTDYSTDGGGYGSGYDSEHDSVAAAANPWQEFWDEQAQAKYWFNNITGEATWTRPPGVGGSRPGSARAVGGTPTTDDWVAYVDEETGQEYWYNAVTGETSWS